MPLIQTGRGIVTQINVFTVPPGGQQSLIDHLADAVAFTSTTPGWLSASLHRSLDGSRVVNYAQTESPEAAQAVIARLARPDIWSATRRSAKHTPAFTKS